MDRNSSPLPSLYQLSPPAHPRRRPSVSSSSIASSSPEFHRRKRRRLSHTDTETISGTSTSAREEEPIESIDLTEVEGSAALARALSKQQEDAVKAQQSMDHEQGRSVLTSYKCPVCMDTPVDATSTVCGHLFCHKCIIDTLKFSEEQRADTSGKGPRGTCPVCRKQLTRTDTPGTRRNLIPLQLKLTTRKRNPVVAEGA